MDVANGRDLQDTQETTQATQEKNGRTMKVTAPLLIGAALLVGSSVLLNRSTSKQQEPEQEADQAPAAADGQQISGAPDDAPGLERAITIGRSANDIYRYWREPANLARIMAHFAEVQPRDRDETRWLVHGPLGQRFEWDSRIVEDRPGVLLRWKSLEGASLPNEGSVRFRPAPGRRGTEVLLGMRFDPPMGALGDATVKLLGFGPEMISTKALRRCKSLIETGEIPTLEHNPSARATSQAA